MIRLALAWTLVHSLWEGAAIAILLAAALTLLRASRARYAAACMSLLATLAGFVLTFFRILETSTSGAATGPLRIPPAPLDATLQLHTASTFHPSDALPWLTPLWLAGVVLFHLYSLASWLSARRMLRQGVCIPPQPWRTRALELRDRLQISRPVELLESCLATVPVVIGYLRPVILIPAGLLTGMPAAQMEAILLHELAHIRRHDYLVSLLQATVEGFLFYHPAVWWTAHIIRAERENCCDDIAVALSGDAHEYASALAALEQTRWTANDAVLAATGGNLMHRIRRLLNPLDAPRMALSPVLSAALLTLTAALALAAWQTKTPERPAGEAKSAYQAWLKEDVAYIINDDERAAFKRLETDDERRQFISQFWLRRDPTPGTERNEFQEEHYRRIAYANDHFAGSLPGWKTDRGRVYIVHGPPDEIESHPAGGQGKNFPWEQWLYHRIEGVGDNIILEFDDTDSTGDYRMTVDPHGNAVHR